MIWFSDSLFCVRAHCLVLQAHDLVFCVFLGLKFGFWAHHLAFGLTVWFSGSQKCFVITEHCGSLFGFLAHCLVFGLTVWFRKNNFVSDSGAGSQKSFETVL